MKKQIISILLASLLLCPAASLTAAAEETVAETATETEETAVTPAYSKGLDENGFFEGVKASDIVKLPDYKGIKLDDNVFTASDDELQEQIDQICQSAATEYEQLKEGTIKEDSTVNIDYVGKINGVAFEGGSTGGNGSTVEIANSGLIPGFAEQLVGHKVGEVFDINVKFPDDYGKEDLNGKDAVFTITVNYLQGELIIPEFTDELAQQYGFQTTEGLLADVEVYLLKQNKAKAAVDIFEAATVENIPESIIEYFKGLDYAQYEMEASYYGMTVEDLIKEQSGSESIEAYYESRMDDYKKAATAYLASQAIAENEGLTVTDGLIDSEKMTDYIGTYGKPYIKQYLMFNKVIPDFILDNCSNGKTPETKHVPETTLETASSESETVAGEEEKSPLDTKTIAIIIAAVALLLAGVAIIVAVSYSFSNKKLVKENNELKGIKEEPTPNENEQTENADSSEEAEEAQSDDEKSAFYEEPASDEAEKIDETDER